MNGRFKVNTIKLALCLAYPALGVQALAAEPYPPLPVALSTAVAPNVLLILDTSLSMNDNPSGGSTKKITSAKTVAKKLITDNPSLRWGLFSFDGSTGEGSKKRADIGSSATTLTSAIDGLTPAGTTPLAEALFEAGRYWAGETSYFSKISGGGSYTSPIQYRCQKNFNIYMTDGESTADNKLPGACSSNANNAGCNTYPQVSYTSFNSAGVAVSKNFGICRSTSTTSSVTCPAVLEGASAASSFYGPVVSAGFSFNSYMRSIRDVSAYLFDRDMKYDSGSPKTLNDNDGASWDDPKFPKQNVITYTIGFDIDEPVLAAAATVGGGKYYTATNEATLATALNNAVSSIISEVSNAGGVATTNPAKVSGNKMFQPVFNPIGWYGELRCYEYASITYDADGIINGGACSPNAKAKIPTTGRKIWSARWTSSATWSAFDFLPGSPVTTTSPPNMTAQQATNLGSTKSAQNTVVNFVRGIDDTETTVTPETTRVRPATSGLLGDITDSQPQVVTKPSGITTDSSYTTYQTNNASRNIVFIGANDGMLHAFNVSDMTELMGFVPSPVYSHLAALPSLTYGASGGTAHTYGVNGELRQADVKLGSTTPAWKTIVVGGLAQGGQGFFAIDATSSSTLTTSASSAVKWEWNDQHDDEMGYSYGAPLVYNVRTSATTAVPAVILVNGYENYYDDTAVGGKRRAATTGNPAGNTSALYIVNADTGALIKKISVTGGAGLSSPAGVDFGQDGILDYVYAGDMNGKLWRFDLTDSNPDNFKVGSNPIFDAGTTQPIIMRPAVKPVSDSSGNSRGNLVLFGTGKLQLDSDRNTTTTQSFYAVLDDMAATPTTVSKTDLVSREVDNTTDTVATGTSGMRAGTYRAIRDLSSSVTLDLTSTTETKKGWYINLPAESERLVSSPLLMDYMVIFGTGVPASSKACIPGGVGWVMGVDPMTGGVTVGPNKTPFSFIDVKSDGKSNADDKLNFSSGKAYASGFSMDGIPTELTYVAAESKVITISSSGTNALGDAGNLIALQDANLMGIYTGNATTGTSKGNPMGRPGPNPRKGGDLVVCGIGGVKCEKNPINPPSFGSGYRIETSIWREIK